MSAFHRVDDIEDMDAARFFSFAERLHGYRGVMRMRAEEQAQTAAAAAAPASPAAARQQAGRGSVTHYSDISENPAVAELFGPKG